MRINKIKIFGGILFAFLVIITACDDDVTLSNLNGVIPESFFKKKSDIEAASVSVYSALQTQGLYQRYAYVVPDLMSDEMVPSGDPNFKPPYDYGVIASSEIINRYWKDCYKGILRTNYVIGNEQTMLDNMTAVSDYGVGDINQAVGEAHFLRGFYYFLLVKRYGGVPLSTAFPDLEGSARATEEATYDQVIADFKKASELLGDKSSIDLGRVSKGAALGMLGKANLFVENYQDAKDALGAITGYSLLPADSYTDNFNVAGEFNDESLFEVNFTSDNDAVTQWGAEGEGLNEITYHAQEYTGWGNARPSQKLIDEFEVDDPRKELVVLIENDGKPYGPSDLIYGEKELNDMGELVLVRDSEGGNRWYKYSDLYENAETTPASTTNTRVLRYADVILMKAEIANKMNDDASAITYLNEIRNRFSLPLYGSAEMDTRGYPVDTPDNVFKAIVHERMIELCGEQHRFDDLVRWGLDATELVLDDDGNARNYNPATSKFLPIPQDEINTNPNLSQGDQNPGF